MARIHVCLNLEHEARELLFVRGDFARGRRTRQRARRVVHEHVEKLGHAEVVDRGAEHHGCLPTCEIFLARELWSRASYQLDFIAEGRCAVAQELGGFIAIEPVDRRVSAGAPFFACLVDVDAIFQQVIDAAQIASHADRPGHGRTGDLQDLLDLIQQIHRVAAFAIQLVDEGHDRRIAQAAHLHQLDRAVLNALRAVDDHQRRIHRRQRAIGVFGEVFVSRRIEQIHHASVVRKLHHRGCHGNSALLLERHPVGRRVSRSFAALHRAGELNRTAEQQQLLGERRLTGVWVRDDGERAPTGNFVLERGHETRIGLKARPRIVAFVAGRTGVSHRDHRGHRGHRDEEFHGGHWVHGVEIVFALPRGSP